MIKIFFPSEHVQLEFCKIFGFHENTDAVNGGDLYDYFDARRDEAIKLDLSLEPKWRREKIRRMKKHETSQEQYQRLARESALPVAFEDGSEMIVESLMYSTRAGQFPGSIVLIHRDFNGKKTRATYKFYLKIKS